MLKEQLQLDAETFKPVATTLFDYLFRGIDKYEYRRRVGDRNVAKVVWSLAETKGYILRNCKLFAYAVHCNRAAGRSTSPARFGIMQDDVHLLRGLDLSHISAKKFRHYSLDEFDHLEKSILGSDELNTMMGKYVSAKLIFLVRHYNLSRSFLEGQLIDQALFALRKQYPIFDPTQAGLHALNICKAAIHNRGMGLIEFYTRKKRNALTREGDGTFQAVNVPIDSLHDLGVAPLHDDPVYLGLKSLQSLEHKMKPRVRSFLSIAAGQRDDGFSLFLGVDNSDAVQSWDYERYMGKLRDYLGVTEEQQLALMVRIKNAIEGELSGATVK